MTDGFLPPNSILSGSVSFLPPNYILDNYSEEIRTDPITDARQRYISGVIELDEFELILDPRTDDWTLLRS